MPEPAHLTNACVACAVGTTNTAGEMGDNLPAVNIGTGRTALALTAGNAHTCALLDNGAVKCWGENGYGTLGLGDQAWPTYPKQWGEKKSPTFPAAAVEALRVSEQYTAQIAADIADARRRYRALPGRVVVFGHSQGAAFAHLLAARYPWLVEAYFARRGPLPHRAGRQAYDVDIARGLARNVNGGETARARLHPALVL
ncbi:MAG: hypothetical protein RJA70_137 [Pseudomonadota bacterium]